MSMMRLYQRISCCVLVLVSFALLAFADEVVDRDEKLISTFQIVRFPNDVCIGSNSRNGTCYTSAECSDKGGTSSGSCADGFGVCCTFVITACGSSTSENITYWATPSAGVTAGSQYTCGLTVCSVSDDICTLRIDFTTFVITGPNTLSTHTVRRRFGHPSADLIDIDASSSGSSLTTNCLYDTFTAQGASPSSSPPEVCGTLSKTHMYVEADTDRCNLLQFTFADYAVTTTSNTRGLTTLASRSWDMTVSQIECSSSTNPPVGCTQFFWGAGAKYVLSNYNYQGNAAVTTNQGIHLANQNQRICIRRERGNCIGCFATDAIGFKVSGSSEETGHYTYPGGCCGYLDVPSGGHLSTSDETAKGEGYYVEIQGEDAAPMGAIGFDCVIIPGAFVPASQGVLGTTGIATTAGITVTAQVATVLSTQLAQANYHTPSGPQICGQGQGIGPGGTSVGQAAAGTGVLSTTGVIGAGAAIGAASRTVCTRAEPFVLEFISDDLDGTGGEATENGSETYSTTQTANLGFSITHTQIACS
jgi:hypothetical protein